MTLYIHVDDRELDAPFDDESEALLVATIAQLPAAEFWTVHRLFDGETINSDDQHKLFAELEQAVLFGLPGEDELQKLCAYTDNADTVRLEFTERLDEELD